MTLWTDDEKEEWLFKVLYFDDAVVRDLASRFVPWELYSLPETGQVVTPSEYYSDGTLKVYVDPAHNNPRDSRTGCEVFGIKPADLAKHAPAA